MQWVEKILINLRMKYCPICGGTIDVTCPGIKSIRTKYGRLYFCSFLCKEAYLKRQKGIEDDEIDLLDELNYDIRRKLEDLEEWMGEE